MDNSKFRKTLFAPWFALIVITLAAFVVYSNVYHCPFVFDDIHSIVENTGIRDLSNFSSPGRFLKSRAVVDFTFALNYRFGKLDVFGYHLVNVLIHIINGFLVYFLALTIFKQLAYVPQSFNPSIPQSLNPSIGLISLFAALIFVAHPIQTQAVTYIVQRYASLATMLYMASVLFYLKARVRQQRSEVRTQRSEVGGRRSEVRSQRSEVRIQRAISYQLSTISFYVLCIICGMLAFMSKQNTASLPGIIVLVECMCFGGAWRERARRFLWLMPAFILYAAFVLYTMGLFGGAGIGSMLEDVSELARETELVGRWSYLCTQFNVLVIYIRLLFLPVGQNLDYLYPFKTGFFDAYTPLAFLFLVGLAGLAVWNRNRRPVITFGMFWFFITLSVESSIIPIKDALFEHRLYFPMFGFAIVVSWLVFHFLSKRRSWAIGISAIIVVSLGSATFLRNRTWQDHVTLWTDVAAKVPHNPTAHNNLGKALGNEGRLKEAIKRFSRAVRINPGYLIAYNNLGLALIKQGKHEDAVRLLSDVRKNKPNSAETCVNLGVALQAQSRTTEAIRYFSEAIKIKPGHAVAHYNLGNSLGRQGKTEEKIRHLSRAIQIDPSFGKAYRDLGVALLKQGRFAEAIGYLSDAAELMPDSTEIHINLGITLMRQGRADEAIRHFFRALRIEPDNAITLNNLGAALARQGRYAEAVEYISKALKIKPDYAKAHHNLGAVLEQQGKLNEAIYHFSESLRIKPGYARAHYNLGIILARQGNFKEAISHYHQAMRLKPDFSAAVYYNMACIYARQNKIEESIDWLKKAIKSGYKNWGLLKTDKDLENIRGSSYYKEIIEELGDLG